MSSSSDTTIAISSHLSKLVCSKCGFYLSYFPIYQSKSESNQENKICGRCYLPEDEMNYVRVEIYEEVARNLKFPCRYQKQGCHESHVPADIPSHEQSCCYQTIRCPMQDIASCTWQGLYLNLANHSDEHISFHVENDEIPGVTFANESFNIHHIVKFNNKLFLIQLYYMVDANNNLLGVCSYLGFEDSFSEYSCLIKIRNKDVSLSASQDFISVLDKEMAFSIDLQSALKSGEAVGTIEIILKSNDSEVIFNKDLLVVFKCPVCDNYMLMTIYQCTLGHSLCHACFVNVALKGCPICGSTFANGCRNYSLENVAKCLNFPCKNEEKGCKFFVGPDSIYTKMNTHEDFCLYGTHLCPLKDFVSCSWHDCWNNVSHHIETNHSEYLLKSNSVSLQVNDRSSDKYFDEECYCNILKCAQHLFKVLFFCRNKKKCSLDIQFIGPGEEAKKFNFEIQMKSGNSFFSRRATSFCFEFGMKALKGPVNVPFNFMQPSSSITSHFFTYTIRLIK